MDNPLSPSILRLELSLTLGVSLKDVQTNLLFARKYSQKKPFYIQSLVIEQNVKLTSKYPTTIFTHNEVHYSSCAVPSRQLPRSTNKARITRFEKHRV